MHHNNLKILIIGDLFSKGGLLTLEKLLPELKKSENIDFTIVNGENVVGIGGITMRYAKRIFKAGVNVITLGNHTFDNKDITTIFQKKMNVIKPFNLEPKENMKDLVKNALINQPKNNNGSILIEKDGIKYGVLNAIGRVFLDRLASTSPFEKIKQEIQDLKNRDADIIILDFHAEATAEKKAMGHFLDGELNAVVCTHTHVQTSDESILEHGTAYITDLGMTGPHDSVIGVKKSIIVRRFANEERVRFEPSKKGYRLQGVIIEIDKESKVTQSIKRIDIATDILK